jgi:hypothetical protein
MTGAIGPVATAAPCGGTGPGGRVRAARTALRVVRVFKRMSDLRENSPVWVSEERVAPYVHTCHHG